jgi:hypothetical protein
MIRIVALACCVASLAGLAPAQERQPYHSPEWAATKSVLLPGWGQWSNGDGNTATALFAVATVGVLFGTRTVGIAESPRRIETERGFGWILYGLSAVWGGFDAYARAREINRENGYDVGRIEPDVHGGIGVRVVLLQFRFGGP